jgi:hypothetical protein
MDSIYSFFSAEKISPTNELSTKSRVMGDCQARFREKGRVKAPLLTRPDFRSRVINQ